MHVPDKFVPQILNMDETGQKLYEEYVAERINGTVSLLSPVRKQNNKMFQSGNIKNSFKICDVTVDIKETKDLYGTGQVKPRC